MFHKFFIEHEQKIEEFYNKYVFIKFLRIEIQFFWGRLRMIISFLCALLLPQYLCLLYPGSFFCIWIKPISIILFVSLFIFLTWISEDLIEASGEPEVSPQFLKKITFFKSENTPFELFTYRVWHVCLISIILIYFLQGTLSIFNPTTPGYVLFIIKFISFYVGQGLCRALIVLITDFCSGKRLGLYKTMLNLNEKPVEIRVNINKFEFKLPVKSEPVKSEPVKLDPINSDQIKSN